MKTQYRYPIILLALLVALLGMSLGAFSQTHDIYIDVADNGTETTDHYMTFYKAVARANQFTTGETVIHLRRSVDETHAVTIEARRKVRVINDTGSRLAIRYQPETNSTTTRLIGIVGEISFGGDGCTGLLIVRGQNMSTGYNYPIEDTATRVLMKVVNDGVLNIGDNCEICYGRNNIWINGANSTVNQYGGVIHSAGLLQSINAQGVASGQEPCTNVNITRGTFNMYGGYIVGHYVSATNTAPDFVRNPILNYESFIASSTGFNNKEYLDQGDVLAAVERVYGTTADDNTLTQLNKSSAVYVHDSKNAQGKPEAWFNMEGGYICGFYSSGTQKVIIDYNSSYPTNPSPYVYYTYTTNNGNQAIRKVGTNAVVVNGGKFTMSGGKIYANYTTSNGGCVILTNYDFDKDDLHENFEHTTFTMTGGELCYGEGATGGAVRVEAGCTVDMQGGKWHHCVSDVGPQLAADRGGGGAMRIVCSKFLMSGNAEIYNNYCSALIEDHGGGAIGAVWQDPNGAIPTVIQLDGGEIHHNKSQGYGGGISATDKGYVDFDYGGVQVSIKGCKIYNNQAIEHDGGGVFISGKTTVTIDKNNSNVLSEIYSNNAHDNGGGIIVKSNSVYLGELEVSNCNIYSNQAINGGGIYTENADVTIHSGTAVYGHNINGTGGGVCIVPSSSKSGGARPTGTYSQDGGEIRGNSSRGNGGGICITGCAVNMTGGTIKGNHSDAYGGGVYISGGDCTINGGTIGVSSGANSASQGGGIYADNGNITISSGNVSYNTATSDGGGIYAHETIEFSNGSINNNSSTGGNGGGVYIYSSGTLNLTGSATISGNNVATGQGGGVYQGGSMFANSSSLTVSGNTKGSAKALSANNVYLPHNKTVTIGPNISTSVNLGVYTQRVVEGSIASGGNDGNNIPVLDADASDTDAVDKLNDIFNAMLLGTSSIVDDRSIHKPVYVEGDNILYFGTTAYDYYYSGDFSNPIHNAKELYQYMCWVNGINGYAEHPGDLGQLVADIDLSNIHYWTPIGVDATPFSGTFEGNGHAINNLSINAIDNHTNYGLFGTITTNANISDVFVHGFNFIKNEAGAMGAVVGLMQGGTVKNCGGDGVLNAVHASCITGGLVGNMTGGTVHSCYAMTEMTGYQMGGLVGSLASGSNLYNSFANAKFTAQSGSDKYMGGLVGVNAGRIENCYARIQNATNPSSNYFGWIAGQNNSGTVTYCYIPTTDYGATYVKNGTVADNKCTSFGPTSTPYQYKHHDNQVAAVSGNSFIVNGNLDRNGLKGLLPTLNNWVNQDATHSSTYLPWMRTSASPINSDYPIHNYTDYVCVGSPDNIVLEYSDDFNKKFAKLLAGNNNAGVGTIYLYNSPTAAVADTLSNNSKATELYIHEDVVMLHSTAIKAHVGITLDNSAGAAGANPSFAGQGYTDYIDWHFFSSALADAPIGLTYGDEIQHVLGEYPSWHATFTNANGYFPTNLNDVVDGDDYYEHWDLYGYYEPDYHWVNYKRNSASHWHEDWPDIPIPYTNDTEFVPGKGYMVALKDEGYLQAYGTLNTNTGVGSDSLSVPVTCTSSIGWTTREGHNLLGNPYQSYLDFDEFASENASLWNNRRPFYIIMDEYNKGYVLYTVGQSHNPKQASRFLHPHQGFMIDSDVKGWARFDNGMRTTSTTVTTGDSPVTWEGHFRGEETPCYPLVNLMATDANGNRDIVTVELGRPDKGGALKQDAMHSGKGSLWCRYEDEDYALVFTQPGLDAANIRFACDEDAEFTMTWSTHNGTFSYLHLIDNMTGADIDCLSTSEYTFSARESDYNSRFRLVFDYTGIDDHEVPEPVEGPATFAYYANGEIHLTDSQADASLQIIDMTGRTIVSRDGVHTVSTTGLAAGVYVLRLTTANGTRIQKIVLN